MKSLLEGCFKWGTLWCLAATQAVYAGDIKGLVMDKALNEPMMGVAVRVEGADVATVTDMDGKFVLKGLKDGRYTLLLSYISYKSQKLENVEVKEQPEAFTVQMEEDEKTLNEVSVVREARKNTELAMVQMLKNSPVILSSVSSQEIAKSQDNNAGEVIRRVPGVSLIEDKFVMVRGLSQRYNNVWVNGGAVPSSEADSRAFSFDIIPSGQIDNLVIVKTPSPEYPSDYTGGFILVNTKDIPEENNFSFSLGGNWNQSTHFQNFCYAKGAATDFLGFDNGMRSLDGGIHAVLKGYERLEKSASLTDNGLNNDWLVKNKKTWGDLKFGANMNHYWTLDKYKMGLLAAFNYTNEYRTMTDMQNNLLGAYDITHDCINYFRQSTDDQYNHNVRLGAMLNLTFLSKDGKNKYQIKNIFNQLGNDRYTSRIGIGAQSDNQMSGEYYYRSRTTYNGQVAGKHSFAHNDLDWSAGYAYANRNMPDRRRYLISDYGELEEGKLALGGGNDISREFTRLDEHIFSLNVNDKYYFSFGGFEPMLQAGAYGEYRTRTYDTRLFTYNWMYDKEMPQGFRYMDIPTLLSDPSNFGPDRLYLYEDVNWTNNYSGNNMLGAGYLLVSLPFGPFSVYGGVRYEHDRMELVSNTRKYRESPKSRFYTYDDFFPSLNTTYKFNDKHQMRLSYGKSVNRPEFREVSPMVFYDFDLASNVEGNTDLKPCYIHNVDLRYEFYPSKGEQISVAGFFKYFDDPMEWTYTVAGGTDYVYSYKNAKSARNFGMEIDIRKSLDFIGLRNFSLSFNGALIHSRVQFEKGSKEKNRPMQGQSPYLINTGLFYKNDKQALSVALLYNRIGKRIIGVGRTTGNTGSEETGRVPDSYEMPRDVLDFSVSKKFREHWEIKANVRDLLAQKISYKQFADVVYGDGHGREVEQVVRQYRPGRNYGLSVSYTF